MKAVKLPGSRMKPISFDVAPDASLRIVTRNNIAVAVIIPKPLSEDQMRLVRCIFPDFLAYPECNRWWSVWTVIANESWFLSQRKQGLLAKEPNSSVLRFECARLEHVRD